MERLLTAREAAAYLHISLFTLKEMQRNGLIPYRTPGGHRRYSRTMLDEHMAKSTQTQYGKVAESVTDKTQ